MVENPKKKTFATDATPAYEIVPDPVARKSLDITEQDLLNRKFREIEDVLWRHEYMTEEDLKVRITRAIELFNSLKPEDGAEGMLVTQMVATHIAAIECLRYAALPDMGFQARDANLKHAEKLMGLYARQLETLDKHRGKGQQTMTVEQVNVDAGGQAIVGHVETGRHGNEDGLPRLEQDPSEPLPPIERSATELVSGSKRRVTP